MSRYRNNLLYVDEDFMRRSAPEIAMSANATADELNELALMGLHIKTGTQLVVTQEHLKAFKDHVPDANMMELAWPSRTVELYMDAYSYPTVLGGILSSKDFRDMGFLYWREAHDPSLHILIQETQPDNTIQCRYTPGDLKELLTVEQSMEGMFNFHKVNKLDVGDVSDAFSMGMSALYMYKAISLMNIPGAFVKYAAERNFPWRDGICKRPLLDSFIFTGVTEYKPDEPVIEGLPKPDGESAT